MCKYIIVEKIDQLDEAEIKQNKWREKRGTESQGSKMCKTGSEFLFDVKLLKSICVQFEFLVCPKQYQEF